VLSELHVSQLGVIEDLALVLGAGMTALTGETGAGKTLVVEAVELLVGGRADGLLVRPGAAEASVEGRFLIAPRPGVATGEVVLSRVVPADGRSRAYVDGRMASVGSLAELGGSLVDLHGQHAHQSLFSPAAQREALDAYARADPGPRDAARARLRMIQEGLARAGGDAAARQREIELLEYQLAELEAARLTNPQEEEELAGEEDKLVMVASHRAAAERAYEALAGEDQLSDRLGSVLTTLSGHLPLAGLHERLRGLAAELADCSTEARGAAETLEEDPERLAQVVARRALLRDLRRKYGRTGAGLGAVLAFAAEARERLAELQRLTGVAAGLGGDCSRAQADLVRASQELGSLRRGAAASLGDAVEAQLRRLAMPRAVFEVRVGGQNGVGHESAARGVGQDTPRGEGGLPTDAGSASPGGGAAGAAGIGDAELRELSGEDVTFLLAANPGEPVLPLSRVASGGELARAMLALRLALLGSGGGPGGNPRPDDGPETLVFDEVDAGIGGEAALAVGRALAELGRRYQVIVVTHLAQVAAFAGSQVSVAKVERDGRSVAVAGTVVGQDRVIELSRMLSGQPDSETARLHAEELLARASGDG
jgi:DNA repair protein RecN (Recombination protein N)